MASLNKVFLMGNLTRKPELRHTNSGMAVCEVGMAISRRFTSNGQDREEVCFVDALVWGRQGESCQRYLDKGDPILIEGRLQLDQWQDKQTGTNRSKLRVVADRVQFLARRGSEAGAPEQGGQWQPQPQSQSQGGGWDNNNFQSQPNYGNPPQMPDGAFDVDGAEDDIPF